MVAVAMMANARLRVGRLIGSSRERRPDRLELRLLLVGQLCIEVVQRRTYGLDRLQHGIEPLGGRLKPCRRGGQVRSRAGALEPVPRPRRGPLARHQAGTFPARWLDPWLALGR